MKKAIISFAVLAMALMTFFSCTKEGTPALPEDAVSGALFSVSPYQKVAFSKGNLWAIYTDRGIRFKFADHQYDYIGHECDTLDLFCWAALGSNWGINTEYISTEFKDWGGAVGKKGQWRTLTADEWCYLLDLDGYGRGFGPEFFKYSVEVCGVTDCLVIAPDGNKVEIAGSYDETSWAAAEKLGFVCLPPAGGKDSGSIFIAGNAGFYWSSTFDYYNSACCFYFDDEDAFCTDLSLYDGGSVRLVSDREATTSLDRLFEGGGRRGVIR